MCETLGSCRLDRWVEVKHVTFGSGRATAEALARPVTQACDEKLSPRPTRQRSRFISSRGFDRGKSMLPATPWRRARWDFALACWSAVLARL